MSHRRSHTNRRACTGLPKGGGLSPEFSLSLLIWACSVRLLYQKRGAEQSPRMPGTWAARSTNIDTSAPLDSSPGLTGEIYTPWPGPWGSDSMTYLKLYIGGSLKHINCEVFFKKRIQNSWGLCQSLGRGPWQWGGWSLSLVSILNDPLWLTLSVLFLFPPHRSLRYSQHSSPGAPSYPVWCSARCFCRWDGHKQLETLD